MNAGAGPLRMEAPREIDDGAPVPAKVRFAIARKRPLGLKYNARLRVVEPHDSAR